MSITIDDVIKEAWHVAAEPIDAHMDVLRDKILEFSGGNGYKQHNGAAEKLPEPEAAPLAEIAAQLAPEPVKQPEAPEDTPRQRLQLAVVPVQPQPIRLPDPDPVPEPAPASVPASRPVPEPADDAELRWLPSETPGETKLCTSCKQAKLLTDFHKDKSVKSGRRARCGECDNRIRIEQKKARQDKALAAAAQQTREEALQDIITL
jgi:hypothetical protein